ncbi:MAG: hypothetical protein HQL52_15110 [Magnetococcales bacterium]|nr:hypothetical protein [Magnetococcales bacterium]
MNVRSRKNGLTSAVVAGAFLFAGSTFTPTPARADAGGLAAVLAVTGIVGLFIHSAKPQADETNAGEYGAYNPYNPFEPVAHGAVGVQGGYYTQAGYAPQAAYAPQAGMMMPMTQQVPVQMVMPTAAAAQPTSTDDKAVIYSSVAPAGEAAHIQTVSNGQVQVLAAPQYAGVALVPQYPQAKAATPAPAAVPANSGVALVPQYMYQQAPQQMVMHPQQGGMQYYQPMVISPMMPAR